MRSADRVFCLIAEKIRFLIFTSFISDITLFSMNELVHHDLTVENQIAYGNISYTIVFMVFCLGTYDVMKILGIIEDYKKVYKPKGTAKTALDYDESANIPLSNMNASFASISNGNDAFAVEKKRKDSQSQKLSGESASSGDLLLTKMRRQNGNNINVSRF